MDQVPKPAKADSPVSRRAFMHAGASAGFITAAVGWGGAAFQPVAANAADQTPADGSPRQLAACQIRQDAAQAHLNEALPVHKSNGDEGRYVDKRASFSKTLPHNDAGEVDVDAFETFVTVLTSGEASGFETMPRDRAAEVALNDPQATYAFDLVGLDSAATALDPAPAFSSALMASEMAEIYWLSLTRDVPFREYERDPLILAALSDINAFSEPLKSGAEGKLAAAAIFRGETPGDLLGPYLSQFLWLDIPYGIKSIEQRYIVPARGQSFLTDHAEWLACQRGAKPRASLRFDATPRFICSARELAEYVHRDFSFQAYMNAALIILALGKETRFRRPIRIDTLGRSSATSLWAARTFFRCLLKRLCSDRRAHTSTSGKFIAAFGRSVLLAELRRTPPGGDNTIFMPIFSIVTPSPALNLSTEHACYPSPSPREVRHTHPIRRHMPAMRVRALPSSKPSSTATTSCLVRLRLRQMGWRLSPGAVPALHLGTRSTSSPVISHSVVIPPAFTTAPTVSAVSLLASNRRWGFYEIIVVRTTSASTASLSGSSTGIKLRLRPVTPSRINNQALLSLKLQCLNYFLRRTFL